jgi:UDP-glucose 4-epimerase
MKILVTGAAGFVGSHICRRLVSARQQVIAVDRVSHPWRLLPLIESGDVRYVESDLTRLDPLSWKGVEQVWHFAANADIPLGARDTRVDFDESVAPTVALLDACVRYGVPRFLFASSGAVYGLNDGHPLAEAALTLRPESMYAAGKLAAEAFIQAFSAGFDLSATILRFGNIVGPDMERGIVLDFLRRLRIDPTTLAVLGDGRQSKSYVHVDDAVDAAWFLGQSLGHESRSVFNVAAGQALSTVEVARLVSATMGLPPPTIRRSTQSRAWAGDQPIVLLDVAKAATAGWSAHNSAAVAVSRASAQLLGQLQEGVLPDAHA